MGCREDILDAVATILSRSDEGTFGVMDVVMEMQRRGSRYSESTIRTHVTSRMCLNAPSHHGTTYADFERIDRNVYRLVRESNLGVREPVRHSTAPSPSAVNVSITSIRREWPPLSSAVGRVGLVGCVKKKLDHSALAADLYVSPLFRGRRAYVERTCERWLILSALHGVVRPDAALEPYDVALNDASQSDRRAWARKVLGQLDAELGSCVGLTFEIHAGANYADFGLIQGLEERGAIVVRPVVGLRVGEQLAFYAAAGAAAAAASASRVTGGDVQFAPRRATPDCEQDKVRSAIADLAGAPTLVPARDWPAGVTCLDQPGLYAWWVDDAGAADLSRGLGLTIDPGRIYAGLAGATWWPSGKTTDHTLGRRIGQMHLGGKVRMSTFRWTVASLLFDQLEMQAQASMVITPASEQALSEWMREHLCVAVHPYSDRDTLAGLEHAVLQRLDPPFNLRHMQPTPVRKRLTRLRRQISRGV